MNRIQHSVHLYEIAFDSSIPNRTADAYFISSVGDPESCACMQFERVRFGKYASTIRLHVARASANSIGGVRVSARGMIATLLLPSASQHSYPSLSTCLCV